jgi:excisionase family DNA binding protein
MAQPSDEEKSVDRWLSVDEIAVHLGITRDTVYKWIERWDMPAYKIGRLWKFRKRDVDEWVLSSRRSRPSQRAENHGITRGNLRKSRVGGVRG